MVEKVQTAILYCKQCSNCCCAQIELNGDDVVINAYRIIPGRITFERDKVPYCRNLKSLLGLSKREALKQSSGT